MPRFVRPAYIRVSADGIYTEPSIGPKSRDGSLRAALTLRQSDGGVSPVLTLRAGGNYSDGTGRASLDIPRGFAVTMTGADGVETVYSADDIRALTIRPVA